MRTLFAKDKVGCAVRTLFAKDKSPQIGVGRSELAVETASLQAMSASANERINRNKWQIGADKSLRLKPLLHKQCPPPRTKELTETNGSAAMWFAQQIANLKTE